MRKSSLKDFNTAYESGFYSINQPSNGPTDQLWGVGVVFNADPYIVQVAFNITGSERTMYYRVATISAGFIYGWNKVTAVEI